MTSAPPPRVPLPDLIDIEEFFGDPEFAVPSISPDGTRIGLDGARDSCAAWPAEPKPTYPFPDRVEGLPSMLTISITGDSSTPYDAGIRLAEALGSSRRRGRHERLRRRLDPAYLVDLRTPPADARCAL